MGEGLRQPRLLQRISDSARYEAWYFVACWKMHLGQV
jgi:hypothetical protein